MACPTCDHTMRCVGHMINHEVPLFWCPRCGTLKANVIVDQDDIPRLVHRCRDFAIHLTESEKHVIDWWEACGIRESITNPTKVDK